jgi:hypothetical protein
VWGQNGHNERAVMPGGGQRIMPIDIRIDQTLPAFTGSSLDGNPGNGSPDDGDPAGQINAHLLWETKDIVDEDGEWSMTIGIFPNAPRTSATLNVTPRRCQRFKPQPGERVTWTNTSVGGPRIRESGEAVVDQWGLVTIPGISTSSGKTRIRILRVKAS